ncbi:MAG: DUF3667 domain-containing protein [Bacteroidota bacterium]
MKSSTRFKKNKRGTTCLNCGQTVSENDNFCPNCAQVNDENRISLKQYFSEYLSGFYSFDNRFIKTVIPLIFKPGKVTREYIEGKRVKYVNPFQLYLNITIVFFLIQGIFSAIDEYKVTSTSKESDTEQIIEQVVLENQDLETLSDSLKTATIEKTNNKTSIKDLKEKELTSYLDSVFLTSEYLEKFGNKSISKAEKDTIFKEMFIDIRNYSATLLTDKGDVVVTEWKDIIDVLDLENHALDHIKTVFKEKQIDYKIPGKYRNFKNGYFIKDIVGEKLFTKMYEFREYDKDNTEADVYTALDELGYEKSKMNVFYYRKAQDMNKFNDDEEFKDAYLDNIISKISIALFFLLPVFTLIVALLYIRSKYNYTEHLVFVFHVQTAFFIILILAIIIDRIFDIGMTFYFIFIFLFYLYKALRNFYKQGRFKTLIKHFVLNTFYVILAFIGGLIVSFIAFLF